MAGDWASTSPGSSTAIARSRAPSARELRACPRRLPPLGRGDEGRADGLDAALGWLVPVWRDGDRARSTLDDPRGGAAGQNLSDRSTPGRTDHDDPGTDLLDRRCQPTRGARALHDADLGIHPLGAQLALDALEGLVCFAAQLLRVLACGEAIHITPPEYTEAITSRAPVARLMAAARLTGPRSDVLAS